MQIILEPEVSEDSVWSDHVPIVEEGTTFTVYLTGHIEVPHVYNKVIHLLNSAQPYHTIHFEINNGGGAVDSAFYLINAMQRSKAKLTCNLTGMVASASTIIALKCHELTCGKYLSFMAHNYSHSSGHDSGNRVRNYVNFTDKELKRAFSEIYCNFLTQSEIDDVTQRDKEIWLNELQVLERWSYYTAKQPVPEELTVTYV